MKETYPIPTAGKKPPAPSVRKQPQDCYLETQKDWEEAIFRNANHFTVFRLHRRSTTRPVRERESTVFAKFSKAIAEAGPDPQALVYAVTINGDNFCVPRTEWARYLTIWLGMVCKETSNEKSMATDQRT